MKYGYLLPAIVLWIVYVVAMYAGAPRFLEGALVAAASSATGIGVFVLMMINKIDKL